MVPVRVYDSRKLQIRPAGSETKVTVAGVHGVPGSASAVVINLTSVSSHGDGHMTVYPCGSKRPSTSNLNYSAGQTRANAVLAKVGAKRQVCIYTEATSHILVDVSGYVPVGGTPEPIIPVRRYDSRKIAFRSAGSVTKVKVAGVNGVPGTAQAVFLNVAAALPQAPGHLRVYPCGAAMPSSSNVNFAPGSVAGNAVFSGVGQGNEVCIHTTATTHLIVDLTGFVVGAGSPEPVVPFRVADSRKTAIRPAGSAWKVKVAGLTGVPADATTVVLNVTAVNPQAAGHLTVYPCGSPRPATSNINYVAGQIIPNLVLAKVGTNGRVCIYTKATSHIVVDLNGFVAPSPVQTGCYIDGQFVVTSIDQYECNALAALHFSTVGSQWINNDKWMTATDPCTWYGVVCKPGHVTELWLGKNNLSGKVPQEIESLSELEILTLSSNAITEVNPAVTKLAKLEYLFVGDNQLTALPSTIGDLSSLYYLGAGYNNLTSVPTSIGKLSGLGVLRLESNDLSTIPSGLGNLTQLVEVRIDDNNLGSIPPGVKNLAKLDRFTASHNVITWVPLWFANLSNLTIVDLSHNRLSGPITNQFQPISPHIGALLLNGNLCLQASKTFTIWLDINSPGWKDGCPP